jgi:hypothetical protein
MGMILTVAKEILWNIWTGFIWLRIETSGGLVDTVMNLSSIKCCKFLEWPRGCWLVKDSSPWWW